jgi:hypothetical protein
MWAAIKRLQAYLVPALIGVFLSWYFTRFAGLNPFNVNWLLPFWNTHIDAAANYLGWEYFRSAPLLQWPLGRTPNLGPGAGASVAMTDSIPLLAFLFKPFTHWFDRPFQYFGIWTLACFVLQSIAAWKLLAIWIKEKLLLAFGTSFFVVAPAFLDRMTFHFGLTAHWVLLISLYLFFRERFSLRSWVLLGVIATLIQPYLALMVSAVFLFDQIARPRFVRNVSSYLAAIIFAAWQSGLFVFGASNIGSDGFGVFSTNGLSLVDPGFPDFSRVPWSGVVPNLWENVGQYEGFAFLGVGVITLSVLVLVHYAITTRTFKSGWPVFLPAPFLIYLAFQRDAFSALIFLQSMVLALCLVYIQRYSVCNKQKTIKALIFSLLLVVFALSNTLFIGDRFNLQVDIPSWLLDLTAIARTSGRFIWIPMYLVVTLVVVAVVKIFPRYVASLFLVSALIFQVDDSSNASMFTRDVFRRTGPENTLPSDLWNSLGSRYSSVEFVPAVHKPRLFDSNPDFLNTSGWLWRDIGVLGQKHDWSLNSFYFGRNPESAFDAENQVLRDRLAKGEYDPEVLYIFIGSDEWELAKSTLNSGDLLGTLDGVPVIAPALDDCIDCDFSAFVDKSLISQRG